VWLTVGLAVAIVVLPSSLRPPPDQANTSAEFSPDAPPDESPDAIIQSLKQAGSRTAGGRRDAAAAAQDVATTLPPPPPPKRSQVTVPSRGYCIGNPPRQTASVYSAPCAPAFVGDNGGATYKGVTREEVRVAFIPCSDTTDTGSSQVIKDNPPDASKGETENARTRTYRVYQKYFNTRFELYGRKLRFVSVEPERNDATSGPACSATTYRNAAVKADEEFKVFGISTAHPTIHEEGVSRKLMMSGLFGAPQKFYEQGYPHEFSWEMDASRLGVLNEEFVCKQVVGRNATFAGNPLMHDDKRKLGLILFEGEVHDFNNDEIQANFRKRCGAQWDQIVRLNAYDNNRNQTLATAIATMKANNITTVSLSLDFLTAGLLTHQATSQNYRPEWLMCGCGGIDRNQLIQLFFDNDQWSHAFGIMPQEIARPREATDWWQAYKEIDPANDPDGNVGRYVFREMQQYVNGIQRAGPNLTPLTFLKGLQSMGYRKPDPKWSIGGGYGPGDYSYGDYASLVWYDRLEPAPDELNVPGAYRHLNGGQRYAVGQIPTQPVGWFKEGIGGPPPEDL